MVDWDASDFTKPWSDFKGLGTKSLHTLESHFRYDLVSMQFERKRIWSSRGHFRSVEVGVEYDYLSSQKSRALLLSG